MPPVEHQVFQKRELLIGESDLPDSPPSGMVQPIQFKIPGAQLQPSLPVCAVEARGNGLATHAN